MSKQAEVWEDLLSQARKISTHDLARHADVSLRNGHKCEACFTCAALNVVRDRAANWVFGEDSNAGFFAAVSLGVRCEISPELFGHWLDALPPRAMGCTVKLADMTTRRVTFTTSEGDDTPIAFWREGSRCYAQQVWREVTRG